MNEETVNQVAAEVANDQPENKRPATKAKAKPATKTKSAAKTKTAAKTKSVAAAKAKSTAKAAELRARRYSEAEKEEILEFIKNHNSKNQGRGGQAAAVKQFGISAITIGKWRAKDKSPKTRKSNASKSVAASSPRSSVNYSGSGIASKVRKLADKLENVEELQKQFNALSREFNALQKELDSLKNVL